MRAPKRKAAKPTLLVTNSMRSCFMQCRRKFWWTYEQKLTPRTPSMPLVLGHEFHLAMEGWYGKKTPKAIVQRLDHNMAEYKKELLLPHIFEKMEIGHGMMRGLLAAYFKQYADDKKKWKVVDVERTFDVDAPRDGWRSGGKMDMAVEEKKKLWLVEHKTTGDLSVDYVERLPLDNQVHHYLDAGKQLYGRVAGIIYNVVMKCRFRQKGTESFPEFCKRVEEDYELNPSKYFFRTRLVLPAWSLKKFIQDMTATLEDIERAREGGFESFYRNTTHCYHWGPCPFVPLCSVKDPQENLGLYDVRSTPHPELDDEEAE